MAGWPANIEVATNLLPCYNESMMADIEIMGDLDDPILIS